MAPEAVSTGAGKDADSHSLVKHRETVSGLAGRQGTIFDVHQARKRAHGPE
jgi:hypothetical protein